MSAMPIAVRDTVRVSSGRQKGKTGEVMKCGPGERGKGTAGDGTHQVQRRQS